MGTPQKAVAYIEIDEYLALEAASAHKHEFLDGVIYSVQGEPARGMAGGSAAHAQVIRNTGFALHGKLRGTPCQVMVSDMRLRIGSDAVFYPDVLVHCGPIAHPAATTELTSARLVIEVLSPTTKHFDRGAKLRAYQGLAGLQQVILLSSTEEAGWTCQRADDVAPWSALEPWPVGTALALPALGSGLELAWDEVYAGVAF